jgi:hypothetical protein
MDSGLIHGDRGAPSRQARRIEAPARRRAAKAGIQFRTGRFGLGPVVKAAMEEISDKSLLAKVQSPVTVGVELEAEISSAVSPRPLKLTCVVRSVREECGEQWIECEFLKRVPYKQVANFVRV